MTDHKLDAEPENYRVAGSPAEVNVIGRLVEQYRGTREQMDVARFMGTVRDKVTAAGQAPTTQTILGATISSTAEITPPSVVQYPSVLLRAAIVNVGDQTTDGTLVEGVSIAWFEIVRELGRNPAFLFEVPWRKLEELIAGAYEREGWPEVVLTPRSGDRGRDVIATRPGFGSIRIFDQVKAYAPGHRVTADDLKSLLGTLLVDRNVSKGVVTTSSVFAPGIVKDSGLSAFMPYRLELKDGPRLLQWLTEISERGRV